MVTTRPKCKDADTTQATDPPTSFEGPTTVDRVIALAEVIMPFIGVILAATLFWQRGMSPLDLVLLLSMYAVTMVGIGAGFHRYFAHRSFKAVTPIRVFLAIAGCMAAQGPVTFWCSLHRIHHRRSDLPGDPHSPHQHGSSFFGRIKGFLYAHVGWLFWHRVDSAERSESVFDLLLDPVVQIIDRLYLLWVFLGLVIPAMIGGFITGSWNGAWTAFIWGGLVRMFLVHHGEFSINSICHVFGSSPYQCGDRSKNNAWVGLLAFGDGWHNNHHRFPVSARHGLKSWQFDLNWYFILLLKSLRLARDVKSPSKEMLEHAAHEDMAPGTTPVVSSARRI